MPSRRGARSATGGIVLDRRLKVAVSLLAACALVVLGVLRAADLWWRRDQIERAGERRAANLALILAEYLREAFTAVDSSLRQLTIHGQRIGGPHAAAA